MIYTSEIDKISLMKARSLKYFFYPMNPKLLTASWFWADTSMPEQKEPQSFIGGAWQRPLL